MIQIVTKLGTLDIYDNTSLNVTLNSTLYFGQDVDLMQGSFVFPFTIPASPSNNILLDFPNRVSNAAPLMKDVPTTILYKGAKFLKGFLNVLSATNTDIKVNIILNPFGDIQEKPLNTLDLGHYDFPQPLPAARALMTDTCYNPRNYPFIYIPIWNTKYRKSQTFITNIDQNFFWSNTQSAWFETDWIVSPCLRIEFIFLKMFKNLGFKVKKSIFKEFAGNELALMSLYTNKNIMSSTGLPIQFELNELCSTTKVGDFVKKILRRFNGGLFWSFFDNKINIRSFVDVLKNGEMLDLTDKAAYLYEIINTEFKLGFLTDKKSDSEPLRFGNFQPSTTQPVLPYFYVTNFSEVGQSGEAIYILPDGTEFYFEPINTGAQLNINVQVVSENKKNIVENEKGYESPIYTPDTWYFDYDEIESDPYKAALWYEEEKSLDDDILLPYRGVKQFMGGDYPTAHPYLKHFDGSTVKIGLDTPGATIPNAAINHRWVGDNNLFEVFWKKPLKIVAFQRKYKTKVNLSIEDFYRFAFDKKIMINSQTYLPISLKLNLTNAGVLPSELELIKI